MSTSSIFHGLSAFPITPCAADGRVEADGLVRLVSRLAEAGVDSIGLLGSTGTYAYLSRTERRRAIEIAVQTVGRSVPVIVSAGALRTDEAEELARDAAAAGASGLLLAPMSYTPLSDEEVFQHIKAVAQATCLPLCLYNNPATTHFTIGNTLIERLSKIENIVAVKNPAVPAADMAAVLSPLRQMLPESFAIGYSGDWNAAGALLAGADAWYSVVGGLLPAPALALTRAAQAADHAAVARIDAQFQLLWSLFKELSSLRVMYAAAGILGLTRAEPPRPILPLGKDDQRRVEQALDGLI
ncbi:dihydrodipicolinate synthase family protein [Pararhizobium sp.]|uniref:dihydrodipicolinate synthase family protein n=1 Tax=Pararhizobium sp. TaxID=1977563 RepID=UPI002728A3D2|nr:dihydrodipicolinate synthase family protein [Pararhizobium sp.]MDO9414711.1 dihydrodipicolinate synthase family protein [Pararhizobium sp.]